MKKIFLMLALSVSLFTLTGCNKFNDKDAISKLKTDNKKTTSYIITADMEIMSNEEKYTYDVSVNYKEGPLYKVILTNKNNSHTQIILKNKDGVYVITPSLNKSFKFQSMWPNNSSQSYIPEIILKDILSDNNRVFKCDKELCDFTTKVNYPNNKNLSYQKITYDKNMALKKVIVFDKDGNAQITVKIKTFEKNKDINDELFLLSSNVKESAKEEVTSKLESAIYPMYLPVGSTFQKEEIVNNDSKERIILTFTGEKSFILVEELSNVSKEFEVASADGELVFYENILGTLTDTSINWTSNGKDYYLIGQNLSKEELLKVASSTYLAGSTK
ncbi:MAG: hypothetical protein RSG51_02145 [Bacilli bacterium]